jgi:hypothetical protein
VTANNLSISEGTVFLYMKRVTKAIRNCRDNYLRWPNAAEREVLKADMQELYFPGCLGSVDGTLIRLDDKPLRSPYVYFSRKKFYAVGLYPQPTSCQL